jgi:transposase
MDSPFEDGIGCAKLEDQPTSVQHKGGVSMKRTTIGIDIAKNVFEIYVEDGSNQVVARKRLARKKMLPWFANHPPALVGLEACGGAHYWARELTKLGHEVRLIAPQYGRGCSMWGLRRKRNRRSKRSTECGVGCCGIGPRL